jgi:hypothetical protein
MLTRMRPTLTARLVSEHEKPCGPNWLRGFPDERLGLVNISHHSFIGDGNLAWCLGEDPYSMECGAQFRM